MSNNIQLKLRPPRLFNAARTVIAAAAAAAVGYALTLIYELPLQTAWQQAAAFLGFLFAIIAHIAAAGTAVCSFLNVISPPTVRLDNEKIAVLNTPAIPLQDITEYTLDSGKKTLTITYADQKQAVIKQRFIDIPLQTLQAALDLRMSKNGDI